MIHTANSLPAYIRVLALLLFFVTSSCSDEPAPPLIAAKADTGEADFMAQAQAVHTSALTIDAHADIEIPGRPSAYVGDDGLSQVEPAKMRSGGMDAVVMSVAVGPMPRTAKGYTAARNLAESKLAAVDALVADPDNNAVIPLTADDLVAAHANGKSALILGFQNALILGEDISALDYFYDAGVRVFSLTHMGHNNFADSSRPLFNGETGTHEADAEHGGLSPLGMTAINKINALGGIVDISQLSKQAALQVIELSSAPVIASHSNVRTLTDVSRNLSDEEIDLIGTSGGVIHVAPFRGYLFDSSNPQFDTDLRAVRRKAGVEEDYLYPFELYWEIDDPEVKSGFLKSVSDLIGPLSLDDMLDHLDYIVQRIGVDHVGIGTDFNHGSGIPGYKDASEALNITVGLLKRGYSEEDIKKIWGDNFIRVWRSAEQAGSQAVQ